EAIVARCGDVDNLLVRCVRNESVVKRVREFEAGKQTASSGSTDSNDQADHGNPFPRLNVLIVYLDAVSRRHFHRKLPQTVSFLETIHRGEFRNNVSSVYQFFGYHALGVMTKLNLRAMYTGTAMRLVSKKYYSLTNFAAGSSTRCS